MTLARSILTAAVTAAFATLSAIPASTAAEDAAPATFVALKFDGACDDQNNRLWLSNSHTFKTIAVKVRWRAAGGKDLEEQFFPQPNSVRELGCAASAEIIESAFADF